MKRCLVLVAALTLLLSQASAVVIPFPLGANPDGFRDTAKPCLDGVTACRPPGPSVLACDDSAGPSLSGLPTGTPFSSNWRQFFSGSASATATLSVVTLSGTDATTNGWAVQSSGAGDNLANAANNVGSGSLSIRGTTSGHDVDCLPRNWSFVLPPSTDTTPPTSVTGIAVDSVGTLAVTLSIDSVMDPNDSVARSGIASYKFYRNSVFVDSLAAPSAGLVCDFTGTAIGTGAGSATQGSGANGAKWTIAAIAGYGTETSTPDSYYGTFCPVSGSAITLIDRVDSLPNVMTYNKSHSDARNGSGGTSAHYDCVIMRIGSAYYMQRVLRAVDGGTNSISSASLLPGAPPYYRRKVISGGLGSCAYSTDGGAWTVVVSNEAITLNSSKIDGVGVSTTSTGSNSSTITAVEGSVALQTDGRVSKTLTVVAGTATFTATAIDVEGNETAAVGSVSATPASPSTVQVKYHQGHYVWDGTYLFSATTYNSSFVPVVNAICADSNIAGMQMSALPDMLEGATQGDYAAGFAIVDDALSRLHACGKRLMLQMQPHQSGAQWTSAPSAAQLPYPSYWLTSTYGTCCAVLASGQWQYGAVLVPKSGGGSSASNRTSLRYWSPAVADLMIAIQHAYLARYDSNPDFEMIVPVPETAIGGTFVDNAALATQYARVIDAGAIDGPHTPVRIGVNFMATDSQFVTIYTHCAASGNCVIGGPDPLYAGVLVGRRTSGYAQAINIYNGTSCNGCTVHDWRGQFRPVSETQWDGLYVNWSIVTGTVPSNCDEAIAAIRAGQESAGFDAAYEVWDQAGPSPNCWNPSGAQTGILDSIDASHAVGTATKPGNFPDVKTD